MAATTALLHYAGDGRPVKLKRMAQEAPAAHPERVEARSEVREATERRDDDHGDHGGAKRRRRWCTGDCSDQNEQPAMD